MVILSPRIRDAGIATKCRGGAYVCISDDMEAGWLDVGPLGGMVCVGVV